MSRKRTLDSSKGGHKNEDVVEQDVSKLPIRDTSLLFASPQTLYCARQCVPCAYKIGNFDVSLDDEFCKIVPNQRPEQCPRSSMTVSSEGTMGYRKGMSVLTVGDGDFSFSLALARLLKSSDTVGSQSKVVATSYEDKETLCKVYPNFQETLAELESLGSTACYKVDATRLNATLPSSLVKEFNRVCWNFPCTAIAEGQDGQNHEMESNKDLLRRFVANARYLLSPGDGEIHICHKTKPPYNQWKLENAALENLKDGGHGPDLHFAGRVVLDRFLLPPYTPRKALDRKSFPCHDACFYIFRQIIQANVDGPKLFPSTIDSENTGDTTVLPVTPASILSVRGSLLRSAASKARLQNKKRGKKARRY
jgi:25S rRNA (uracil2634-N3)-methyltransferase